MLEVQYPSASSRSSHTELGYTTAGYPEAWPSLASALDPWLGEFNFKKSCSAGNRYAAPPAIILTTHAAGNMGFIAGLCRLHSSIIGYFRNVTATLGGNCYFFLLLLFFPPIVEIFSVWTDSRPSRSLRLRKIFYWLIYLYSKNYSLLFVLINVYASLYWWHYQVYC